MDHVAVFTENDSNFCVDIASTKDGKFITVNSNSRSSSEERNFTFFIFQSFLSVDIGISFIGIIFSFMFLLQVFVINATNPQTGLQKFCKRVSGVQYFLEHHHGYFYVLTNAPIIDDRALPESGNYYLARCGVENLQSTNLQVIFCSFVSALC